jgi:putative hydrolase of the HAD superfamily
VLAELAQRDLILGIASNFDQRLHQVVDGLSELSPIQLRVISSEVGRRKPDPRFFAEVVRQARCDARAILFVGDSRENDYEPADAAGMRAVLFDAGPQAVPNLRRIRRLSDLRPFPDLPLRPRGLHGA